MLKTIAKYCNHRGTKTNEQIPKFLFSFASGGKMEAFREVTSFDISKAYQFRHT